jgi:phospholipid/cholesterol/gamma-HCH transport system substrate-binding protein
MARLSNTATKAIVAAVLVAVIAGVVYFVFSGSSMKKVSAEFDEAIGVYSGTPVKILGVPVGQVTGVHPKGGYVRVDMEYESKYKLPANAGALLVANSLVSDRFIQLTPAYASGATLPNKAVIPESRTASPAELDDIYKALSDLARALGPNGANKNGALQDLLAVSAANLDGNGQKIKQSIHDFSVAVQTLSNNRGDLFATVRNLQQFTKTLQSSDAVLRHFEEQLAQVASDLASERADFGAALHQLGLALDAVAGFVKSNAAKIHLSLDGLKRVTAILVAEKGSLDETLAVGPVALANIVHAYQPAQGVIATRGNVASFNDPKQLCLALKDANLLTAGVLGSLLNPVVNTCNSIVAQASGATTKSASQVQLSPDQLVPAVRAALGGNRTVGGLITGGDR